MRWRNKYLWDLNQIRKERKSAREWVWGSETLKAWQHLKTSQNEKMRWRNKNLWDLNQIKEEKISASECIWGAETLKAWQNEKKLVTVRKIVMEEQKYLTLESDKKGKYLQENKSEEQKLSRFAKMKINWSDQQKRDGGRKSLILEWDKKKKNVYKKIRLGSKNSQGLTKWKEISQNK